MWSSCPAIKDNSLAFTSSEYKTGRQRWSLARFICMEFHLQSQVSNKGAGGTNLPELHNFNVVYLQNARFTKMTLYLQKKWQLLELEKQKQKQTK